MAAQDATGHPTGCSPSSKISNAIMPTLIEADRGICGEFQIKVGMPAGSALRLKNPLASSVALR